MNAARVAERSVVVRVPFHHEMSMAALNAGKHVFTEWPLGANLAEAQDMAGLARAKGVHTLAGLDLDRPHHARGRGANALL